MRATPPAAVLIVAFDVSGLAEPEVDALVLELHAQGEARSGEPEFGDPGHGNARPLGEVRVTGTVDYLAMYGVSLEALLREQLQ